MGRYKFKDGIGYYDDGGASKSDNRLLRRKRNKLLNNIKYAIVIAVLLYVSYCFISGGKQGGAQHIKKDMLQVRKKMLEEKKKIKHGVDNLRKRKYDHSNPLADYDNDNDNDKDRAGEFGIDVDVDVNDEPTNSQYRWTRDSILPPMKNADAWAKKYLTGDGDRSRYRRQNPHGRDGNAFYHRYGIELADWEHHLMQDDFPEDASVKLDYTEHEYEYPDHMPRPPRGKTGFGPYPAMEELGKILERWPQDDIDNPPSPFVERLQHFDYTDPEQMEMAQRYRDLEFPFKLYNVPELLEANEKWTDDYLSYHFDRNRKNIKNSLIFTKLDQKYHDIPRSNGHCQEGVDSFFAFFNQKHWIVDTMGDPPTLDTDFTFARWASHARYADAIGLAETETHYYWQSGVPRTERRGSQEDWTMISLDLPSFSDPKANFISFNPKENKGIQCRFGERGLTAATHYDGGRNMIGMITGAKRYILSPPNECHKLGIVSYQHHPTFRHSLLNFGHINILDSEESKTMPKSEREWLEAARSAMAVDTVLKAGEILYIPSHWFHYITSLQKSAQCNTRSGREFEGSKEWGSSEDVLQCVGDE